MRSPAGAVAGRPIATGFDAILVAVVPLTTDPSGGENTRVNELAGALRKWRERMSPGDAGLARSTPGRTPGLRREELAVLAGVSIDYVVRLEQGRGSVPSAQVCLALGRALRLSDDEVAYLLRLAGHPVRHDRVPRLITQSIYRIVDRLENQPVSVYDATWQLLHWNRLFAGTFGDPTSLPVDARNLLVVQFEGFNERLHFTPEQRTEFETSLVADLRSATSRYPDDPGIRTLVRRLRRTPRFARLWEAGSVAVHTSGRKIVQHPDAGLLELDSDSLTVDGLGLHVVIYTAEPGSPAEASLKFIAAIGTQDLRPQSE